MAVKQWISGFVVLAAAGLSGCSDATDGRAAPAEPAAESSPASAPQPAYEMVEPEIAAAAVSEVGSSAAREATETAVRFSMDYSFDDTLMRASFGEHEAAALAPRRQMNHGAARDWTKAVRAYNRTNPEERKQSRAASTVVGLTLYAGWASTSSDAEPQTSVRPDGRAATNLRFRSVKTTAQPDGRLQVAIVSTGDARLIKDGKPVLLSLRRSQTYWMKQGPEGWKIDGWRAGWKAGQRYRPDHSSPLPTAAGVSPAALSS